MRNSLKTNKGVAGLTILLSVVTILFVIGLLVMIFSLMGGEMRDATYDTLTTVTVTNQSGGWVNLTNYSVISDTTAIRDFASFTVTGLWNFTSDTVIPLANITSYADAKIVSSDALYNSSTVNVSYTYTWSADTTATDVMNDTTVGISGVTDWFTIFIVITAMVVLILLTVIIVTAIKGSGLITTGGA